MTDFSNYKFRCSALHNLMVAPKAKTEVLSETAKTYLRELWILEVFGREKLDKANKYTIKGVMVEPDSMSLVSKVTGKTYWKNRKRLENEFICGTPDIIEKEGGVDNRIIDIKSSWDIWTYMAVNDLKARKDYYYQLLGYMWLTDTETSNLMYCLVNTPEPIMDDEIYRMSFKLGDSTDVTELLKKNYIFDDIDEKMRLKSYVFDRNSEDIESLKIKILAAREYMKGLSL